MVSVLTIGPKVFTNVVLSEETVIKLSNIAIVLLLCLSGVGGLQDRCLLLDITCRIYDDFG
jgi:hypothetical protein